MKVELLAPAGSYESMKAAYQAGADAVYIGGSKFGARAFAENPDTEALKRAIDYAHLRGKKLYLTVNTLVKDAELEELRTFLLPFYRQGLDAVIVQDLGVLELILREFPQIDLHASTQMTITGALGADLLKQLGASRVVTARELSLQEVREIHEQVDVEIESFVHGALCFCYSGQCLLSSMIGGRSGNRGRCAQPCRLPYQLYEEERRISDAAQPYLCSPKDMCTLDLIPELIESGIYSFKMEGRMKKAEYTAGITAIYRKYIDRYLEGAWSEVEESDRRQLLDLYNRGGFSTGYYHTHNGREMMSMSRPNHWGTLAARAVKKKGGYGWVAEENLHSGDVLELRGKAAKAEHTEISLQQTVKEGNAFSLKRPLLAEKGAVLYRTRNEALLQMLQKEYLDAPDKLPISGEMIFRKGEPMQLTLRCGTTKAVISGATPEPAKNRPLTKEDLTRQLRKFGQTDFALQDCQIIMDDGMFEPLTAINELRRSAAESLMQQLLAPYRRSWQKPESAPKSLIPEAQRKHEHACRISVRVETGNQLSACLRQEGIQRILIDSARYQSKASFEKEAKQDITEVHARQMDCWYVMPAVFRNEKKNYFLSDEKTSMEILRCFDGIVIKSLEQLGYLRKHGYEGLLVPDANLYIWNRETLQFWKREQISHFFLPAELKAEELQIFAGEECELTVYGRTPLMVSAQCFRKNTRCCDAKESTFSLKDRKNKLFFIKNHCSFCYNVLYNSAVTELADQRERIFDLQIPNVQISLTFESAEEADAVLRHYLGVFQCKREPSDLTGEFTRGHFKRGVE